MQEKSIIKQNILKYLEFKGISPYKFYKESGITRGVLSQNNGMSEENTAKFLAYCPNVNIEWLLTGKEPMLNNTIDDIFENRVFTLSDDERKRRLFNSFGDLTSGDEKLLIQVEKLEKMNEMLVKENLLQSKVIEGLEFQISTLKNNHSELKYIPKEPIVYKTVAEPEPELTKKEK